MSLSTIISMINTADAIDDGQSVFWRKMTVARRHGDCFIAGELLDTSN